jgi:hypothetical protein
MIWTSSAVIVQFALTALTLFVAILVLMDAGRRLRRRAADHTGLGAVEGAVFSLMGLLIAFTFSGGATRFDARRDLIVKETNAIGTAWLRVDLLPSAPQPSVRDDFRAYLDARIRYFHDLPVSPAAAQADVSAYTALQNKIWTESVTACAAACPPAGLGVVTSGLNDMIDITTTRSAAMEIHPPLLIYLALGALVLAGALLAGFEMGASREGHWLHMLLFAAILAISIYVILDMEYPRFGLIRVDAMDHLLTDLRSTMQ